MTTTKLLRQKVNVPSGTSDVSQNGQSDLLTCVCSLVGFQMRAFGIDLVTSREIALVSSLFAVLLRRNVRPLTFGLGHACLHDVGRT